MLALDTGSRGTRTSGSHLLGGGDGTKPLVVAVEHLQGQRQR